MDGNAWDLVSGGEESSQTRAEKKRSRSPSNFSKVGSEAIFGQNIDAEELSNIIDADRRERQRRSKSPAVESLRKVSRVLLEKVGIKSRKKDDVVLMGKAMELQELPLEGICSKPTKWTPYDEPKPSSNFLPKFVSSSVLKGRRKDKTNEGKCSYLFESGNVVAPTISEKPIQRVHVYDPYCPVHGRRRKRPALVNMHSLVQSVDAAENDPMLYSQAYIAKVLRKKQRANLTGDEKVQVDKTKRKIKINLFIISAAFLFLFTAFNALQNLQTTINGDMGADCLFVLYLSLAISSLFVPPFILNRLGSKMTLVTAFAIYITYMFANYLPEYYSLLPASVLTGIAGSCLWAAKCVYITESGIKYAKLNIESQNVVIVRFFGIFFMIVHLSQVAGNVLTSFLLTNVFDTTSVLYDQVDVTCGHAFTDNTSILSDRAIANLRRPSQEAFMSIVTVNLCCSFIALLIVVLFLNALKKDEANKTKVPHFTLDVLRLTLRNLTKPKPVLLIPLTIFNGIEQAFAFGIYTKAYAGCALGISHIGYVMAAFGIADACFSFVFGPLIKLFGRMPLFVFGAVINVMMIITLMIWTVNPGDVALFYVICGVWGMADGVWNTQINGFWVALVGKDSLEVAFANYRFWISLGLAIGFVLMRYTTIDIYLLTSFCFLIIGILGYFIIELYESLTAYFKQLFQVCFFFCGKKENELYSEASSSEYSYESEGFDEQEDKSEQTVQTVIHVNRTKPEQIIN